MKRLKRKKLKKAVKNDGKFLVVDTEKIAEKMIKEEDNINPEILKKGEVVKVKAVKPKRHKTVQINGKDKEKGVYKAAEFQAYIIWKSLPAMLRGENKTTLNKFGIEDELSIEMLAIENQVEFAKKFKIKPGTCSEWNKILVDDNLIYESIRRWAKMITPNVIMALGKTAMRTGKAPEVMAWGKIIEDFKDKAEVDASEDLKEIMKKMDKLLPE